MSPLVMCSIRKITNPGHHEGTKEKQNE